MPSQTHLLSVFLDDLIDQLRTELDDINLSDIMKKIRSLQLKDLQKKKAVQELQDDLSFPTSSTSNLKRHLSNFYIKSSSKKKCKTSTISVVKSPGSSL